MPNSFAYAVILVWPIIAILIARRFRLDQAAILLLVVPYLLLPVGTGFYLPVFTNIDKETLPAVVAFFILYKRNKGLKFFTGSKMINVLLVMVLISPLLTYISNRDTLPAGMYREIAALKFVYFPQVLLQTWASTFIPFMFGVNFLRSKEQHTLLLKVLVVAGLCYSIPALWEVRMSPQLHVQIYGFFPHSFAQQMRQGGFRPVIFLGHGLYVALFFCVATIAAIGLYKDKVSLDWPLLKGRQGFVLVYLLVVLVLCKTWSAMIYTFLALPLIMFLRERSIVRVAAVVSLVVLTYPFLRSLGFIDTQGLHDFFYQYSPERAQSLGFRFHHEDALLEKANERAWFGWGDWGRNRVYHGVTGADITVTDGMWIILYGVSGIIGYLGNLGLMAYPVISLLRYKKRFGGDVPRVTAVLALILAFNALDLLPNSSLTALSFLMAGAIIGSSFNRKGALPAG